MAAHSERIRDTMANTIVKWDEIRALMCNRPIALDKCPGIRPIGVGEEPRRILGKTIALATRIDVEETCGTMQLCTRMHSTRLIKLLLCGMQELNGLGDRDFYLTLTEDMLLRYLKVQQTTS